ncbi:MAG: hypothetical protein C5B49_01885 [Bdellovibrio sp.]|nr:MAG: hypothetical protein C5B49_01885 [Bdellovibrio sp.]
MISMTDLEFEIQIRFEVVRDYPHLTLAELDALIASRMKMAKRSGTLKKVGLGPKASVEPVWKDETNEFKK